MTPENPNLPNPGIVQPPVVTEKKSGCMPGCGCGCFMGCFLFLFLSIAGLVCLFLWVDFGKAGEQGFYWVYKAASQSQFIEMVLPPEMPAAEKKEIHQSRIPREKQRLTHHQI